jgi:hypothetical protein
MKAVTCKRCNTGDLHWEKQGGHWYLLDSHNKQHHCNGKSDGNHHPGNSEKVTYKDGVRVHQCAGCGAQVKWVMANEDGSPHTCKTTGGACA